MTIGETLEKLNKLLAAEPAKARAKNSPATARLIDGLQCEVTGPYGERFVTDMPPAMGGKAGGPNPGWLLRSSLASCTATAIAMRAARLGIVLDKLEVTVESESDARGLLGMDEKISAGLDKVRLKVKIGGKAEPAALRELVAWGDAHSPIGCTVRDPVACMLDIEVL
jgi:uncharacterized OsmC-like protein